MEVGPIRRAKTTEENLTDFPTLSAKEAAVIFGWSKEKFKERFGEAHREIRWVIASAGKRFLLVDVIRAAFPDADEQTVHLMGFKYQIILAAERRRIRRRRGNNRSAANENTLEQEA